MWSQRRLPDKLLSQPGPLQIIRPCECLPCWLLACFVSMCREITNDSIQLNDAKHTAGSWWNSYLNSGRSLLVHIEEFFRKSRSSSWSYSFQFRFAYRAKWNARSFAFYLTFVLSIYREALPKLWIEIRESGMVAKFSRCWSRVSILITR